MKSCSPIDWSALAAELGLESGASGHDAAQALCRVIGDERLVASVDFYVDSCCDPSPTVLAAAELARLALRRLRPRAAIERCYAICRHDPNRERRVSAIELLRTIGDASVIPWIDEFLSDDDQDIQTWGASTLPELIFASLIDEDEAEPILAKIERHPNAGVRQVSAQVRQHREWGTIARPDDAREGEYP